MTAAPARIAGLQQAPRRTAAVVLASLGLLAAAGAALALAQLLPDRDAAPVAGAVTAFGPVTVWRVERLPAGAHGHSDSGQLRVSLTATNRSSRAVPYSPGQFRLGLDGDGATVGALDPLGARTLAAGESIRQELAFLVPERPARFTLLVDDLHARRPVAIALGEVERR